MLSLGVAAIMLACPYPADRWTMIAFKRELPPAAIAAFGELAEKNAPFQATDVIVASQGRLASSLFASARGRGCELVLKYEFGGIAHGWATARLRYKDDHWIVIERVILREHHAPDLPMPLKGPGRILPS